MLAENSRIFGYFYFARGALIPGRRGPEFIEFDTVINT
jgi:hypothetical protein